ncbi:hypothetical protein CSPAE12_05895 [Colletotrichum incanum]|nr:hypothetical protein CSPAE12_05895 [Colletotrichum incanum]
MPLDGLRHGEVEKKGLLICPRHCGIVGHASLAHGLHRMRSFTNMPGNVKSR